MGIPRGGGGGGGGGRRRSSRRGAWDWEGGTITFECRVLTPSPTKTNDKQDKRVNALGRNAAEHLETGVPAVENES